MYVDTTLSHMSTWTKLWIKSIMDKIYVKRVRCVRQIISEINETKNEQYVWDKHRVRLVIQINELNYSSETRNKGYLWD